MVKIKLKKSLRYDRRGKLTFEISILIKLLKNIFFQKMPVHAIKGKIYSGYFLKMREIQFSKVVRVKFEK